MIKCIFMALSLTLSSALFAKVVEEKEVHVATDEAASYFGGSIKLPVIYILDKKGTIQFESNLDAWDNNNRASEFTKLLDGSLHKKGKSHVLNKLLIEKYGFNLSDVSTSTQIVTLEGGESLSSSCYWCSGLYVPAKEIAEKSTEEIVWIRLIFETPGFKGKK